MALEVFLNHTLTLEVTCHRMLHVILPDTPTTATDDAASQMPPASTLRRTTSK